MTVPHVIPRRGDGLTTRRPGLLIAPAEGRPAWVALEDCHALADLLVDTAEEVEARHAAAQEHPAP